MKKLLLGFAALFLLFNCVIAQKHLIINTTGYGFDRNAFNGVNSNQWTYIQKFINLTHNGQDASVTAVRLHIQWENYEPTLGTYSGAKLAQAVAAILALKPGIKVALHFQYMRNGGDIDSYFADDEISKIYDGTKVQTGIGYTCPSLYSPTAKAKFYAMVNDAMNAVSAHYSNILYVKLGNASAEEYHIPTFKKGDYYYPGFYETAAVNAWRTDYLPCRYPNQSTVTWDGQTHNIANAPTFFGGEWGGWNSGQHGREYQRFGAWGEMKFFTGFRDIIKGKSSNLKVIYFVSFFGSSPGSYLTLSNATLPRALAQSDGIYTSDDGSRKILAIDVLKGTNMNKLAGIEFDPDDLGQQQNPKVIGINPNAAMDGMVRAYKHGVDYVHIAMHYEDSEIQQLAPVFAHLRANYVNGTYTAPARQAAIAESIVPAIWTGADMFSPAWANAGGNNWASSDLNPVSINMNDNGYWENVWGCSTTPDPCDFTPSVSTSNQNPQPGVSITLTASATGQNSDITYTWSQNGISGNGATKTFNAPTTPGTYTYMVTAAKANCTSKTATVQITVPTQGGGGTGCIINKVRLQFRAPSDCCYERLVGAKIQGSNNGSTWTDLYTFTGNGNGSFQEFGFSNTTSYSSARFVASSTGWGELRELEFYNGTTKLTGTSFGTDNYANAFDGNTATEWHAPSSPGPGNIAGIHFTGCSAPAGCDFNVVATASPTSVLTSGAVSLSFVCTGANCNTAAFNWSGQTISGNENPKSINAPNSAGNYSYTLTATKTGCANKSDTANIVVTAPSGGTGCTVNKVRLKFRLPAECCMDRLQGAKIQGSNNGTTWTDLYTFTSSGNGNWQDFTFTNTTAYSSVRFQASANGWGELYELEFYKGTAKLTGTPFGVGNYANAFDGNQSTDWQVSSNPGTSNHAGLSNLGNCSGNPLVLDMTDPGTINNKLQLLVSPNPSNGILNAGFYLARGSKATIVINDLQGRTIYRQAVTGNGQHNEKIYLVNKSSGTFIIRLETPAGVEVRKINITR